MTTFGQSIRIYLKDGTVSGIRFGEILNKTILSIACPKNRLSELKAHEESKRQGIYFLFGKDEKTGNDKAYIGEGNVYDRLQRHLSEKEFWNEVIIFVSKDENLTKGHVKYLESRAIQIAKETKRYVIENDNQSASPLPLADRDSMEEFFVYIKLLLGVFGHKLLEEYIPLSSNNNGKINQQPLTAETINNQVTTTTGLLNLTLSSSDIIANAIQTDEGIVVLEGSEATYNLSASMPNGYKGIREKLISNGTLVLKGKKYLFQKNSLFDSPSAAASVIVGSSISGPQNWKNSDGKTLKQIDELKLAQVNN